VEARFRRISVTEPFVLMISVIPLARWGRGGSSREVIVGMILRL